MTDEATLSVAAVPHVYVSEDATLVEIQFADKDGKTIRLSFPSDQFERFAARAIQVYTHVKNQKQATSGHVGIHAVAVVAAAANAAAGGGKVILSLKGNQGLEFHFSVPQERIDDLRKQMRKAEESAKRQSSQSRQ